MKQGKKKNHRIWPFILGLIVALAVLLFIFMRFGGLGTGKSIDKEALKTCAGTVEDITIPDNVSIVALGEATHGNVEFQQLKLEVFKHMVEDYGVRAFALEGDYGGCEQVNRYIHGGEGTAQEAAAAIGFAIYRTKEMAQLIDYMRQYNASAAQGDDLRFYGFDMQRCAYSLQFLEEACSQLDVDTAPLEKLMIGDNWNKAYDNAERIERVSKVKTELEKKEDAEQAIHFADMLLQYCALQEGTDNSSYLLQRDKFMAENTLWLLEQEKKAGHDRIFVSGHNGHVAKWGSYDVMGKLLDDQLGEGYYAIGTDFYKTCCNMPTGASGRRTMQTFYSYDPLAKTAKKIGLEKCWLDFSKASQSAGLNEILSKSMDMGSLGESYSVIMRLMPFSYRISQPPIKLYDGMIFVADAAPTKIIS